MNPWAYLISGDMPSQREHWPEPVKTNGRRALDKAPPPPSAPPVSLPLAFPIAMCDRCVCGLHYGAHRAKDYRCPNQKWKPGNGEPQWLGESFNRESGAASLPRQ